MAADENKTEKKKEAQGSAGAEAPAPDAKSGKAKKAGKKDGGKDKKAETVQVAAAGETRVSPEKEPRLKKIYRDKVVPALMKEFNFKSSMQVPRIKKVSVNYAIKEAVGNPKVVDLAFDELMAITGQKPVVTRARKAVAAFKIRKGLPLGVMVTLRRARMYEFMDRLLNIALPRVRDFRGVSTKAFDGRGNYSLGVKEQIIFPEVNYDKVDKIRGMTVTIETTATNNDQARSLLRELGMPFRK